MKRFYINCIIRVLLLSGTICLLAYLFFKTAFIAAAIFTGLLALYQVFALIRYVSKTNRDLTRFLQSIKYSDLFEESEWVRLTLVAVDGNTLVYKNSDLIGTMPYATSSNIQYLGAYQNRNMYFSAQIADFSYSSPWNRLKSPH